MSLGGQHDYLRSVEDLHGEIVHSCDVPLITVHLVRLGSLCGVLLLSWRDVGMHYVKSDLQVNIRGEVNFCTTAAATTTTALCHCVYSNLS